MLHLTVYSDVTLMYSEIHFGGGLSVASVWGSETSFCKLNLLYTTWGTSSGSSGRVFVLGISFWGFDLETVWSPTLLLPV